MSGRRKRPVSSMAVASRRPMYSVANRAIAPVPGPMYGGMSIQPMYYPMDGGAWYDFLKPVNKFLKDTKLASTGLDIIGNMAPGKWGQAARVGANVAKSAGYGAQGGKQSGRKRKTKGGAKRKKPGPKKGSKTIVIRV